MWKFSSLMCLFGITLNVENNWSHEVKQVFVDIDNIVAFQRCSLVSFENPRHFLQEVK